MPPVHPHSNRVRVPFIAIEPLESRIAPAWVGSIANGILAIDHSGSGLLDDAVISLKPGDAGTLVIKNAFPDNSQYEFPLTGIVEITVAEPLTPFGASDFLTFDSSQGLIATVDRPVVFLTGTSLGLHHVTFDGGGASGSWMPGPSTGGGVIRIGGGSYTFAKTSATFRNFSTFELQAPTGANVCTVDGWSTTNTICVDNFSANVSNLGRITIDLTSGDGTAGVNDTLTLNDVPKGTLGFQVYLGNGDDAVAVKRFLNTFNDKTNSTATFSLGDGNDQLSVAANQAITTLLLPDGGPGVNTLNYQSIAGVTLSDSLLRELGTSGLVLNGTFQVANITGTTSANRFDLSGWSGSGTLNGGGGGDTIVAANDGTAFTLSDSALKRSGHGDITLAGVQNAQLSGSGSSFDVSGWTHAAALSSNAGDGMVIANNDGPFLLTDGGLWRAALPQVTFIGITNAELVGLSSAPNFDVTGWAGRGYLRAALADGSVTATNDADFTLEEDLLQRSGHGDLLLKGVHAAALTGGPSANVFDLTGFYGTAAISGAGGDDTFKFGKAGNVSLTLTSPTTATLMRGTTRIDLTDVRQVVIEALDFAVTGDATPRAVVWSPAYNGLAHGSMAVSDDAGETRIDYQGLPAFAGFQSLKLLTPAGEDVVIMSAKDGIGEVTRYYGDGFQAPLGTFSQVRDLSFDLGGNDPTPAHDVFEISSLAVDGLKNLAVTTGGGDDFLVLGYGVATLQLPVVGGAFTYDGGAGRDTLTVDRLYGGVAVSPSELSFSDGGTLAYGYVEVFNLSAPEGITVSGTDTEAFVARPTSFNAGEVDFPATLADAGQTVTLHYLGEPTLTHAASLQVITGTANDNYRLDAFGGVGLLSTNYIFDGDPQIYIDTIKISEIFALTIDLGAGDAAGAVNRLTIHSLGVSGLKHLVVKGGAGDDTLALAPTVTALLPNDPGSVRGSMSFEAGGGTDTLEASADVSMYVDGSAVVYQDNTPQHGLLGELDLPEATVERFVLTGGASANRFFILNTSAAMMLDAGAGDDSIIFPILTHFTGTGAFHGGEGNDTFDVQTRYDAAIEGAGAGASLDGGPGLDTIRAQGDINFHLSDTMLTRVIPAGKFNARQVVTNAISSFENAVLSGWNRANLLDALHFSGHADLVGEGGVDNLIASKGGGALYGFHYGTPAQPFEKSDHKLYTRDTFYAADGSAAARVELHANDVAGNVISFRYYQSGNASGVTYTLPGSASSSVQLVSGQGHAALNVQLVEGQLNAVEGSRYADRLTGNAQTNFLIGLAGNDTLVARGFDYLFGGPGADRLVGITPFKFQDLVYTVPLTTTGATAIPPWPLPVHSAPATDSSPRTGASAETS